MKLTLATTNTGPQSDCREPTCPLHYITVLEPLTQILNLQGSSSEANMMSVQQKRPVSKTAAAVWVLH